MFAFEQTAWFNFSIFAVTRAGWEASDLGASTPATPEVQPGFWLCRANVPQAGISQCRKWRRPVRIIAIPCSSQAVMVSSSLLEPPG
jgi:hypothetical protein